MSGIPSNIRQEFVPHRDLQEGWTYVAVEEDNMVLGVKVAITKVLRLHGPDGAPLKDATGNVVYSFQSSNVVQILTRDEYNAIRGRGRE